MFVYDNDEMVMRRLNIKLAAKTWESLDEMVALSEKQGAKINVERTLASVLEDAVRKAQRSRRKADKSA